MDSRTNGVVGAQALVLTKRQSKRLTGLEAQFDAGKRPKRATKASRERKSLLRLQLAS